jgi:hypothetical protein
MSDLRATRGLLHAAAARATVDQILRVQLESAAEADLAAALDHGAPLAFVHFNLGWLLLEQRPADAQAHFEQTLAVSTAYPQAWLGCALSSVALGNTKAAVEALAMETLAHPDFLYSGWWSHPSLQPLRGETLARVESALAELSVGLTAGQWPEPQARYLQAVVGWLRGTRPAAAVAQCALDATQREFWRQADDPAAPPSLLLSADWRAQPAVRQRLRSHVERAGGILAGARVVQDMALLETARTPAEALRLLWLARPTERPLPRLTAYPSSAGFGVRQRNRTPARRNVPRVAQLLASVSRLRCCRLGLAVRGIACAVSRATLAVAFRPALRQFGFSIIPDSPMTQPTIRLFGITAPKTEWLLFFLCVVLSFALALLADDETGKWGVQHLGYWQMWLLVGGTTWVGWRALRARRPLYTRWWRQCSLGVSPVWCSYRGRLDLRSRALSTSVQVLPMRRN